MKKVLIIEDDSFLLGLEATKLKNSGYEILSASNGEQAVEKIKEPGISVILLDLILPNFDGFDLLKKIRTNEITKNIPVIVFSNLSEQKDLKKAQELGASKFMIKSNVTLDELVNDIEEITK